MATLAEQLTEVQTAITSVLTKGQQYSISGRQMTRAGLAELQVREKYLIKQIAMASRCGKITVAGVIPVDR